MKRIELFGRTSPLAGSITLAPGHVQRLLTAAFCALVLCGTAWAGTITVNSTAQKGAGTTSVCTLGAAIASAVANANVDGCVISGGATQPYTINIPAGTYTLTAPDHLNGGTNGIGLPNIQTSGVTLQGAGAATTIIERSSAANTPNFQLLWTGQNTGDIVLNDLTFQNASAPGLGGGAIFDFGSNSLTVNRCIFLNNSAQSGGAISGLNSPPVAIHDSTFSFNTAVDTGGAIEGGVTVTNTFFSHNSAQSGGAMHCFGNGCTVAVSESSFLRNTATAGNGGAADVTGTITRSTFNLNVATQGNGGAINGATSITDSRFEGNKAVAAAAQGGNGGAVACANCTVSGSTITDNDAAAGGAFFGGSSILVNDSFVGNHAPVGGAIVSSGSNVYNNITVFENEINSAATAMAGGILFSEGDDVRNSIIAGNFAPGNPGTEDCKTTGTVTSHGHNLIGIGCGFTAASGDQIGTGSAPIDPVLNMSRTIGKTAGSTGQTQTVDTAQVLIGSPALDAGDLGTPGGASPACAATDQKGAIRPIGTACDIGSYEAKQGGDISNYDLAVTNSASAATVNVGDNVTYTITVSNPGPDTASGLSLTDAIDPSTFVSLISPAGWSCTQPAAGHTGTVTCTKPSLDHSFSTFPAFSLVVKTTAAGTLNNTANVTSTGNDTNLSNNQSTAVVTVQAAGADLAVATTATPGQVQVGGNVTIVATIQNQGPSGATNVLFTNPVPANVTFVSATPSQGTCSVISAVITCPLGSIAASGNANVSMVLSPQAGAAPSFRDLDTVSATEPDPTPDNSDGVIVLVVPVADLSVTNSASPNPVAVGSNITYTVTVTNNGPSPAHNITLTDTLPAANTFTLVSASATQGSCQPIQNGKLVCLAGTLNSGASATATVVVTANAAAVPSISNQVAVSADETDPNTNNNSASVTVAVNPAAQPDFRLSAPASSQTVPPGSTASYTMTVTPANGFTGNVSWTCTGLPAATTCSAMPNPLAVNGSNPMQDTITIQTTAATAASVTGVNSSPRGWSIGPTGFLAMAGLATTMMFLLSLHKSRRVPIAAPVTACLGLILLFTGCGGHSMVQPGTPKGTYTVTVTATSGQISHSSTITLVVGP